MSKFARKSVCGGVQSAPMRRGYQLFDSSSSRSLQATGRLPQNVAGYAGYGREENYAYLEEHQLGNDVKYIPFQREQIRHRKPELIHKKRFRSENFPYDDSKDVLICPADRPLTYCNTSRYPTENGYPTEWRTYEGDHSTDCPLTPKCTRARIHRRIRMSFRLRDFRTQACENLLSGLGRSLRVKRVTEVETVSGKIKQNPHYRRFLLRGLKKTTTEWGYLCLAHNMKKLAV